MNYTNVILQDELPFQYSSDEMNTPAVLEYSKMFEHLDLSSIQRYPCGVGPNGNDNHSMIKAFIPINKRNAKETPIEIPTCLKELKMKYHSSWYEEKQDRFRIKFACPITKQDCEHRNTKYGCTKYFQVRKSFPGEVQQHSPTFKDTCPQRQSVERVNAFLQNLG